VISGILSAGYFLSPARGFVLQQMAAQHWAQHMMLADIAVWLAGIGITVFCIKSGAANALKVLLPQSVQTAEKGLPAAGVQGWWAALTCFVPWLAAAFFAGPQPAWLLSLLQKAGIG